MPRSSSVGEAGAFTGGCCSRWGRLARAPPPMHGWSLLAVLLVLPVADLAALQKLVFEELGVVLLRDPHRGQQDRRRSADLRVGLDFLAVEERDCGLGGGVRLQDLRLVHGARLPACEDELHA